MELNFNPIDEIGRAYFSDPSVYDMSRYTWSPEKQLNFTAIMKFVKQLSDDGVASLKKIYLLPDWRQISIKIIFKRPIEFSRKNYLNLFIRALQFADGLNIHPNDIEEDVTDVSFFINDILIPKDPETESIP